MRRGRLSLIVTAVGLSLLSMAFSACQRASYYSAVLPGAQSGTQIQLASSSGNGGGYDGHTSRYIHIDPAHPCSTLDAQGHPLPNSEIDLSGSTANPAALLVRDACSDLVPSRILNFADLHFATDGSGDLTYQDLLYVPAPMTAFYVSPGGNDFNPGTLAAPFQTLAKAQAAMQGSIIKTTYVRAGTYNLASPLSLTSADNGETWLYYPPDGADSAVLDGGNSVLQGIQGAGVGNVTIDGFKVQHFTNIGIQMNQASHDSAIRNCDVSSNSDTSGATASGILIGESPRMTVSNNYVHDIVGQGITIFAYNSPTDNVDGDVVSGNVILRVARALSNCAGIYINMNGGNQTSHVSVTNNFVRDYGGPGVSNIHGIDIDFNANWVTATGNVVGPPAEGSIGSGNSNGWAAFIIYDGHDNHISGNLIDLGDSGRETTMTFGYDGQSFAGFAGNSFSGNVVIAGSTGSQQTSVSGVNGYSFFEGSNPVPAGDVTIQNNMYFNYAGGPILANGNLVSDSSPTFSDPQVSGWNYQLAPGSPAFNAPVSFPRIAGGWGPPGFVIPQTGTAPSAPH